MRSHRGSPTVWLGRLCRCGTENRREIFCENKLDGPLCRIDMPQVVRRNLDRLGQAGKHQTVPCGDNFLIAKRLDALFSLDEEFSLGVGNKRVRSHPAVPTKQLARLLEGKNRMENVFLFEISGSPTSYIRQKIAPSASPRTCITSSSVQTKNFPSSPSLSASWVE